MLALPIPILRLNSFISWKDSWMHTSTVLGARRPRLRDTVPDAELRLDGVTRGNEYNGPTFAEVCQNQPLILHVHDL